MASRSAGCVWAQALPASPFPAPVSQPQRINPCLSKGGGVMARAAWTMHLEDKMALVTGAAQGIGNACAQVLLEKGCNLKHSYGIDCQAEWCWGRARGFSKSQLNFEICITF
ncbi:UNVERIFIED_CONTAM: hypothetical protein K2H54_054463 [Gekko kuhli]